MRKIFALALLVLGTIRIPGADANPWRQDSPPNEPYSPAEAMAKMTLPEGFRVELVASEPDLVNPINMAFDDRGRIFVTESIEYPRKPAGAGRDRVKILEDADGDGRAEKVTIFAEGLNIPTGVTTGYGGVWVLNAPDLLFMREKDGKEFSREVVVTGFGRTDTHELPNSLTWGPDGWLYGLNGVFNQCVVKSNNGKEYKFNAALWRVHPRTREFQVVAEGTSNPYGVGWDLNGSAIIEACHWANDHLFHFVETGHYQRQAGTFPPFTMPIGSITDHGHQKTAYCGLTFLETDAYPEKFRGRVAVGNIHGGAINLDRLERDGATYLAKAEPDFFNANDAWCMPVALKIGPDGSLYMLDWYDRYHCSQDAARDPGGVDRLKGRLYRFRYKDTPRAPRFDLQAESDAQLIARLSSGNIYFRESAQRILTERLGNEGEGLRRELEKAMPNRHALWALIGSGSLEPGFHVAALHHSDATIRAWAVRAAGNFGGATAAVREKVVALARDASPDVQLQVAIAARKIKTSDALSVLVDVLAHCGHDKVIPSIAWNNLHPLLETDSARFVSLIGKELSPALKTLAPQAIQRILSAAQPDVASVAALLKLENSEAALAAISLQLNSLNEANAKKLAEVLKPVLTGNSLGSQLLAARLGLAQIDSSKIRARFESADAAEGDRLQALEALIAFKDAELLAMLPKVFQASAPQFTQKVFAALGRVDDPKLGEVLLEAYPRLAAELQPLAIDLIMQRERWARKLLDAALAGKFPKSALNANHLRKILESNDREALWAVEKAFGKIREERNPEREKVVAEMGAFLRENIGNPQRGQTVFRNLCAQCHTMYGEGGTVGPDITANGRASFEQLLSNVFDPSLVIGPAYQVATVVTRDGRNLTGLIAEDNPQRVVVRLPGEGEETVPRNQVKYTRLSKLSMMPEGLEHSVDRKDLADLFAFLVLDKPPGDPSAKLIPGAPAPAVSKPSAYILQLKQSAEKLSIMTRAPGTPSEWYEIAVYNMAAKSRPYLHPVRHPSSGAVMTQDRPDDHPWQHGIFTGFHGINGQNYWKEDQGRQRFVKLLELDEKPERISWRALIELVDTNGVVVLEEENAITFYAPEASGDYLVDYDILLRAKSADVQFKKFYVGGLSVRMPWDKENPRHTHLNSEGLRGRACEQKRAAWCNVERPFENRIFGAAILDHPGNANHPPVWRADEQGLINPNVSGLGDWAIAAGKERRYRHRIVIYEGTKTREQVDGWFGEFAR